MDRLTRAERSSLPPPRRGGLPIIALAQTPLGALAGFAVGAFAGPVGAILGAAIGGVAGGALSIALHRQAHRNTEVVDRYDEERGITRGDLGAASDAQPPASAGLYSAGSAGAGRSHGGGVASGPFPFVG